MYSEIAIVDQIIGLLLGRYFLVFFNSGRIVILGIRLSIGNAHSMSEDGMNLQ